MLLLSLIFVASDNECAEKKHDFLRQYEILEAEAQLFIRYFSYLPAEIQNIILEYVYNHDFESTIDKKGVYIQSIKIPSGKSESKEKEDYWLSIRNFSSRFIDSTSDQKTKIFYKKILLGTFCNRTESFLKSFGKSIIGPNKNNWIIRPGCSRVICYNLDNSSKNYEKFTWCENYSFCLHPTKDILVVCNSGGSSLLEIYTLDKRDSYNAPEHRYFTEIKLNGVEYDYSNLNSQTLIAYNDDNIYKLNLMNTSKTTLDNDNIEKIISTAQLIKRAIDQKYLPNDFKDDLAFTRVTLSTKFPNLLIAVINNRFSFLCDYNSSKVITKCLEFIPVNKTKEPVSYFSEPQNNFKFINEDEKYANLETRRLLRVTRKEDFFKKKLAIIANRADEIGNELLKKEEHS